MKLAPASARARAASGTIMEELSQPVRIFADTGMRFNAPATAATILRMSSGFFSKAAPAPAEVAFGAGQPKFMSIKSGATLSSTSDAASATSFGSEPKICTPNGRPPSVNESFSKTRAAPLKTALLYTNSLTETSAPYSRQMHLQGSLEKPAIGAKNSSFFPSGNSTIRRIPRTL